MIEYIKGTYVSPIEGVTNVKTGWKVTSDIAGTNIVDSKPLGDEWIDVFYSNIKIPINEEVYVWYQLELSNGEIKDWVGPFPYQSRESNISNDLKPLTRVETPTISVDDTLASGSNIITFKSSLFRGDPLDGILAASWVAKNPAGEIIKDVLFSLTSIEEFSLSRSVNSLDKYDYIDLYLKHHSANGATSNFGKARFSLAVYPFKFNGSANLDAKLDYRFNVVPYDPSKPNLKNIKVIDTTDKSTAIIFTDVSSLSFIIPANTLKPNRTYRIELYVDDLTLDGKIYPVKMDVMVYTVEQLDRMTFDTTVEYDLNSLISKSLISPEAKGEHMLIDGKSYVLSVDGTKIYEYMLNKSNDTFVTEELVLDAVLTPYLSNDSKLFNLSGDRAVLVSRVSNVINIIRVIVVNKTMYLDTRYSPITIPCSASRQYLNNTATISLDESVVYIHSTDGVSINFDKVDLSRNEITRLLNREDLDISTYNASTMLIIISNTDSILSIGGRLDSDLYYEYMIKSNQWIPRGSLPVESMVGAFIPDSILLQNKSVLFLNDDLSGLSINLIDYLSRLESIPATISLANYKVSLLNDIGDLYMINHTNSSYIKVESVKS